MNDKLKFEDSTDAWFDDEPVSSRVKSRSEVKREWDHLVEMDDDAEAEYLSSQRDVKTTKKRGK